MSSRARLLLPALAVASFALVIVPAGLIIWRRALEPLPEEGLRVLRLVHNQVLEHHVTEHDPDQLVIEAVRGMVSSLDGYSEFVAPEDVPEFEAHELEGTYVGIGILLFRDVAPIAVKAPLPGSPAERAGLLPGDRILAVDGEDIDTEDPDAALRQAVETLRGPAGTSAQLRVGRDGQDPFEVTIQRGSVAEPKVKWAHLVDAEQGLGYVYVAGFQRGVANAFDDAMAELELQAGGPLRGLVLDLRHDPGGLLDEAIGLANRFLRDQDIVTLARRDDVVVEHHAAQPELCTLPDLPLVVLIDHASASASEVVTGALQDHGRARVVGIRSFGKGVVQSIYTWADQDFRLKLTTSHYYTPNGRSIEGNLRLERDGDAEGGIAPDVEVTLDRAQRQLVTARLRAHEVPRAHLDAARAAADALGVTVEGPLLPEEDPQLAKAVEELRALAGEVR